MQRQQHHRGSPFLFRYRPGLAESQQTAGVAVCPRTGMRKPRDGPVNCTVKVFHTQDCLWSYFYNPTSFPTRLGHQFLMLHSNNVPLADTAFFTIVMDYSIRREAAVAAVAVMIEETGSDCSSNESYEGDTTLDHHTMKSVVSLIHT